MKRDYALGWSVLFATLAFTACSGAKDAGAPETAPADPASDSASAPGASALDVTSTAEGEPSDEEGSVPATPGAPKESKPVGQAATTEGNLTGKLTQADILALVNEHNELFNDCYTIGAGDSQQFVATVTIKATIGPSGKVADTEIVKSTAKNPKVDDCVTTAFKKMPFPKPADGATTVITFPMKFEGAEEIQ